MKIVSKVLVSILFLLVLSSCSITTSSIDPDNSTIGVVTTNESVNKSRIIYYDDQLNENGYSDIEYAGLGSTEYDPIEHENISYMVPSGIMKVKGKNLVYGINRKDLNNIRYDFELKDLKHMAFIGDDIYVVSNDGNDSKIERKNLKSKDNLIQSFQDSSIYAIYPNGDRLLAFSANFLEDKKDYKIQIFTKDLKLEKQIDLKGYGLPQKNFAEDNEYIYTTISYTEDDKPVARVLKINKRDYSLSTVDILAKNPSKIYLLKDRNLVVCNASNEGEESQIIIFNKNWVKINSINVGQPIMATAIYNDKFLMANDKFVRSYDLKNFEQGKMVPLNLKSGVYITGIITRNK